MLTSIYIVRYPKWLGFLGVVSMPIFHLILFFNNKICFYKLMGSGKNGTFDIHPDWRQWAILLVFKEEKDINFLPNLIHTYWQLFNCKILQLQLNPFAGHGFWDGKKCFGELPPQAVVEGKIAVLTRASIRLSKLKSFWQNVPIVAKTMENADGLITSFGIGEVPFIKQATLSIWENTESMKNFAYKMKEHQTVIQKTKKEDWYSEDMFTRFEVLNINGSLK